MQAAHVRSALASHVLVSRCVRSQVVHPAQVLSLALANFPASHAEHVSGSAAVPDRRTTMLPSAHWGHCSFDVAVQPVLLWRCEREQVVQALQDVCSLTTVWSLNVPAGQFRHTVSDHSAHVV